MIRSGSSASDSQVLRRGPIQTDCAFVLQVEGIAYDGPESLAFLGEIGERTSLRHAVQLLTPAGGHASVPTTGMCKACHVDCAQQSGHTLVTVAPGVCHGTRSVQSSIC